MTVFLVLLGIFVYFWIGIQVARFIGNLDDEDIILFVIFWPLVVTIGSFVKLGGFFINQVKNQVKK